MPKEPLKKIASIYRNPAFPIMVMAGFTLLLFAALLFRVYNSDRDLALERIEQIQAQLAAESGIHFAIQKLHKELSHPEKLLLSVTITSESYSDALPIGQWIKAGIRKDAYFRLTEVKKISGIDRKETPLIDESNLLQIISEGRFGSRTYKSLGILSLTEMIKHFAVVNSLNRYYYGQPIQRWIEEAGSLEAFQKANRNIIDSGKLSPLGICNDPQLLVQMFSPNGSDTFIPPPGKSAMEANYGRIFSRDGKSPCIGPLYCQTPIVVDSHCFFGPIQTAALLYRRGNSKPVIQNRQTLIALTSSRRIQVATDNLDGEMPQGIFVDQDSQPNVSYLPPWRPDFAFLRKLAKKTGIYIDSTGKGFVRGELNSVDYHFSKTQMVSETYQPETSPRTEQDSADEGTITLSTSMKFEGRNNIDSAYLKNSKILFSENSIFIRGDLGGDLMIVTPHHIYLTGSLNVDSPFNAFLVSGEGTAISTADLENFIAAKNPDAEFIQSAQQWIIKAVIYKPGAGWYGIWSRLSDKGEQVAPRGALGSGRLALTIIGGCLEGNLQRWINFTSADGIKIQWAPQALDRLPISPIGVNLFRIRSGPDR